MLISDLAAAAEYAILALLLIVAFDYLMLRIERRIAAVSDSKGKGRGRGGNPIIKDLADLVKLMSRGGSRASQNQLLLPLSVCAMLAIAIFLVLVIPLYPSAPLAGLGVGALAMLAAVSLLPPLTFLIGSYDSRRLDGAFAQQSSIALLGYVIPIIITVVTVAMLAGSYGFLDIVNAQSSSWFVLLTPLGFAVFFIALHGRARQAALRGLGGVFGPWP